MHFVLEERGLFKAELRLYVGSGGLVFVAEERGLNSEFQGKHTKSLAGKRGRGRTGRKVVCSTTTTHFKNQTFVVHFTLRVNRLFLAFCRVKKESGEGNGSGKS